ncbi:MAG: hypothetical protein ACTS8R_01530 [Arsenophonus sp. NC-QC1-MAG3]
MKTHPVRITARQWIYLAKTVDMPDKDYETYLSICKNCRDFNKQDCYLGEIAAQYRINVFECIQHTTHLRTLFSSAFNSRRC